jgi:hypothetical protein
VGGRGREVGESTPCPLPHPGVAFIDRSKEYSSTAARGRLNTHFRVCVKLSLLKTLLVEDQLSPFFSCFCQIISM